MAVYVSGDDLRADLGLDAKYAAATQRAVEAISQLVDDVTGTTFMSSAATAYQFDARLSYQLSIPWCTSVSSVATDRDGDGVFETVWSGSDYLLTPYNQSGKNLIIAKPRTGKYFPTRVCPGVEVTAVWGWCSLPPATIVEAVFLGGRRLFKRKDAIFGVQGGGDLGILTAQVQSLRQDPDFMTLISTGPWRNTYGGAL